MSDIFERFLGANNGVVIFVDIKAGVVMLIATIIYLSIGVGLYVYHSPSIAKNLAEYMEQISARFRGR